MYSYTMTFRMTPFAFVNGFAPSRFARDPPGAALQSAAFSTQPPMPIRTSGNEPVRFVREFAQSHPQALDPDVPARPIDSDLARIIDAWPTLPGPIRAAMLALAASGR
jgi:hypothetical protein